MTDDLVVGRCVPLQGGSYIGLHRKDREMAEKKSKSAEVEGLVVKIGVDVDKAAIAEATAVLKELAEAANMARDALDRLTGRKIGGYVSATGGGGGSGGGGGQMPSGGTITVEVGGSGVRPAGKKFKL